MITTLYSILAGLVGAVVLGSVAYLLVLLLAAGAARRLRRLSPPAADTAAEGAGRWV